MNPMVYNNQEEINYEDIKCNYTVKDYTKILSREEILAGDI